MELRLNIGINQIIALIRQLPDEQKMKIKDEIDNSVEKDQSVTANNDLAELLLSGPTMTEEEEQNFKHFNTEFDQWTKDAFA